MTWESTSPEAMAALLENVRTGEMPCADHASLLYGAGITWLYAEPKSGKTILATGIAADCMLAGGRVTWFDTEMGPMANLRLLLGFGVPTDVLLAQLRLVASPVGPPGDSIRELTREADIVVFDSCAGLMGRLALNPNSDTDVETLNTLVLAPATAQAAGIVIDHVTKDRESRGRWPTGSQRKLGIAVAGLRLDPITRFRPGHGGKAKVTVTADRFGALQSGEFTLEADMQWRFEQTDATTTPDGEFRPTILMQKLSEYLEAQAHPVSRRDVESNVNGANEWKRKALDVLIAEAYVTTEQGPRRSILCSSARPFRADEDPSAPDCAASAPRRTPQTSAPLRLSPTRGGALGALNGHAPDEFSAPHDDDHLEQLVASENGYYDEADPWA
jgi:hypothetical protein